MRFLHRMTVFCGVLLLGFSGGIGSPAAHANAAVPRYAGPHIVMKDFSVSGTPVQGASTSKDAPTLSPGQYTDTSTATNQGRTEKYYKVKRTWPGSTLRVNVLGRVNTADIRGSLARGTWNYELRTTGTPSLPCSQYSDLAVDSSNMGLVVGRTLLALPVDSKVSTKPRNEAKACAEADEFLVKVGRGTGSDGETPIEIRVIEEPPIDNVGQLPAGIQQVPRNTSKQLTSPASGEPEVVAGGSSFNDALEVGSGTYVTEVLPGEIVIFKTRIGYGQSGIFSLDGIDLDSQAVQDSELVGAQGAYVPMVYAPDLSRMNSQESLGPYKFKMNGSTMVAADLPVINEVPDVRYRNRWDSSRMYDNQSLGFSMGGYYYYALALGDQESLGGAAPKFRFSVKVSGEVSGEPVSTVAAVPGTSQGDDPDQQSDDILRRWLMPAGGFLMMVVGGAGVAFSMLRRR